MRKTENWALWALCALWVGACGASVGSGSLKTDQDQAPSTDPSGPAGAGGATDDDDAPVVAPAPIADTTDEDKVPVAEAPACHSGETTAWLLSRVVYVRETAPGVARGFNLDGVDTERAEEASCNSADLVDPDGVPGIDNQLALLMPVLDKVASDAPEDIVQGGINDGSMLSVVEVLTDDLDADQCVTVTIRSAKGSPSLGAHGLLEPNQTFAVDAERPTSQTTGARIEGGVVTAGPFELALPIKVLFADTVLHITSTHLRFSVSEDGSVQAGLLGGAVALEQLREVAMIDGVSREVVDAVLPVADRLADMDRNANGVCERLSVGFEFDAVPVFLTQ